MTENEKQTEERIIEAAREVFIEKGMDGARMQEIADRAGINKALLHYYFRTKEKLFAQIFRIVFKRISAMLSEVMDTNVPIEEKVKTFVEGYTDLLMANPFLPNFILNSLTRSPDELIEHFNEANINPEVFFEPLQNQLKQEGYNISCHDLIINLLSMVIFPIAARPIIVYKMFGGDKNAYKAYLKTRKESVAQFVLNALKAYKVNP